MAEKGACEKEVKSDLKIYLLWYMERKHARSVCGGEQRPEDKASYVEAQSVYGRHSTQENTRIRS